MGNMINFKMWSKENTLYFEVIKQSPKVTKQENDDREKKFISSHGVIIKSNAIVELNHSLDDRIIVFIGGCEQGDGVASLEFNNMEEVLQAKTNIMLAFKEWARFGYFDDYILGNF